MGVPRKAARGREKPASPRRASAGRTLVAAGFGLLLILVLHTSGHLFLRTALNWMVWWIPAGLLLILYGRQIDPEPGRRRIPGPIAALTLILVVGLVSSLVRAKWFFFLNWLPSGAPFRSGLVRFILGTALLTPLFAWRRWPRWATRCLLAAAAVILAAAAMQSALQTLGGKVLYRTDHPSFMFRLWEFGRAFPALGGYNPWWNGGIEHFAGVTSGAQGIGLLIYPLLRLAPVHTFYNGAVLAIFILAIPVIAALSVRAVGGRGEAAAAGAILALGVSQHQFLWMWHFGTVGATFSASMVVPVLALSYRAAVRHRRDGATFLGLALSAFLLAMWAPLGATVGLGLIAAYLLSHRCWTRRSFCFLLAAGGLALIAYLPWLRVILFPARGVVEYVGRELYHSPAPGDFLSGGFARLRAHLNEGNPILLFLGLGGVIVAAPRTIRRWYLPAVLILTAVCGWALEWKPLSQLDRVAIPLLFAAVVPAALGAGRILSSGGWRAAPAKAALFTLLVLSGHNVSRLYANRGFAPARTIQPVVEEMVEWIRQAVPENGRLLFAGRAVHSYGWGNIAYLPVLTGREMMADDYYGFPPGTIEYNYPPQPYRRSIDRFREFAGAYNVTHVITRHDNFREFFARHPDVLESVQTYYFRGSELSAYRLRRDRPLLPAAGRVRADVNHLTVEFDGPPEDVILPYNWRNGLVCLTEGAEIEPHPYDENIRLIAVHPADLRKVEIGYRMPWGPVEPNFDGRFHH